MEFLRLKELLKAKGITGKDLAEQLEITENAVSLIVNNKRQPRFELLQKIADILDIDIKDLFISSKGKETVYIEREGEYIPIGEIKSIKTD